MNGDFKDKIVLVVGASRGIGAAVGKRFAELGAHTVFVSRSGNKSLLTGLAGRGLSAIELKADVSSERDVNTVVRAVVRKYGRVDILVNCQAINECLPIEKIKASHWRQVLETNLTSMFLTSKACLPHMKRRGFGRIVNVSSVAARNRSPVSGVHYVASKAGILGFTRQLSFEAAPFGITVNAICPGQTKTDMLRRSVTPRQLKRIEQSIPVGRIADPADQVNAVLFLASHATGYITGAVLDVNGGQI